MTAIPILAGIFCLHCAAWWLAWASYWSLR